MADIDIVPRRRSSTWVWVLLALIVLALIVWAMMGRGGVQPSGSLLPSGGSPALAAAEHANLFEVI